MSSRDKALQSLTVISKTAPHQTADDFSELGTKGGEVLTVPFDPSIVSDELKGAVGLGGRDRHEGSAAERARLSVTRAMRSAIARIGEQHSEVGRHFDVTIRTGTFCSYQPDPRVPTAWEL